MAKLLGHDVVTAAELEALKTDVISGLHQRVADAEAAVARYKATHAKLVIWAIASGALSIVAVVLASVTLIH